MEKYQLELRVKGCLAAVLVCGAVNPSLDAGAAELGGEGVVVDAAALAGGGDGACHGDEGEGEEAHFEFWLCWLIVCVGFDGVVLSDEVLGAFSFDSRGAGLICYGWTPVYSSSVCSASCSMASWLEPFKEP